MSTSAVKTPGPDHPISIERHPVRVRVLLGGVVIADTHHALALREAQYPVIYYIRRADVDLTILSRSEHTTYCPLKGDCSYFDLLGPADNAINAVWSYEQPFDAVADIKYHLAFYPDRVTIEDASAKS